MSNGETLQHRVVEVDGVQVHHFPSAAQVCSAALLFGVGQRDESLATLGTLHMLEHLVMHEVRYTPISINGSVGPSLTDFTAEGSPGLVRTFLEGVCRGLAAPPLSRLAAEAAVLSAEGPDESGTPLGPARYGLRDLGLVGAPGPGPAGVRADTVRAVAERWFVTGNALLMVDGPWPEGLSLPLPVGPAPTHAYVVPRRWERPHAITVDGPGCGFSVILPPAEGTGLELLTAAVIEHRLTEVVRHERGLTYSLDRELLAVADGRWELTVLAEPLPDRAVEAVLAMIDATTGLLRDGATDAEVEHARETVLESARGRDSEIASAMDVAIGALLGSDVAAFDAAAVGAVSADRLNDQLRGLAADVLYLIDARAADEVARRGVPTTEIPPGSSASLPAGEVFRPPLPARVADKDARTARVALTETGLAQRLGDQTWTLDWTEVAGVLRDDDGDLTVLASSGVAIAVGPKLYRRGKKLVQAVRRNVGPDLIWDER